jgi:deferrochelatase/peroxidase EfeB
VGLLGASIAASGEQQSGAGYGAADGTPRRYVPFAGAHQTGLVAAPTPAFGLVAAFVSVAEGRTSLATMFAELTHEIARLMSGRPSEPRDPAFPPGDSGLLGAQPPPMNLSVVVAVGASLFDGRYGLAAVRPRQLVPMPFMANDRLHPERSHGDLLLTIEGETPDAVQFALRQLMRRTRRWLVLKWTVDGFSRGAPVPGGSPRNLMGFRDGTANLDVTNSALMDRLVWVGAHDGEPAWAVGGSYQVMRTIRMLVEFWDRAPLAEQEAIIGRRKESGAPFGGVSESDEPGFGTDPDGDPTPVDSHIRLANPRTPSSQRHLILRRGFSYTRGFDRAGQLDQGLAFVCYQRDLEAGFLTVQRRLRGEPLEEYTRTEGGGFFFVLPGVDGQDHLGDRLLA